MSLATLLAASTLLRAQTPEWIWHDNKGQAPADNEVRFFRKGFKVDGHVTKAILTVAGDDRATAFLNGKQVAVNRGWNLAVTATVTKELKSGENLLAIRGQNNSGDAAIIAKLELSLANNRKQTVVSDTSWVSSTEGPNGWQNPDFAAANWSKVVSRGKLGVQPWGDVLAPRTATPAEKLDTIPGFKVELVRSAEPGEGSWVCMTVDPRGRLIVSPQGDEPILRFTLTPDGKIAKIETIDQPVRGAMGLLYAFDSLYVNGKGKDGLALYRLRDTNGDDQYDSIEFIRKRSGDGGEHGPHGIVVGPDKKLYVVCGNFVNVPEDILPSSPHRNYADDIVLPRMEDGNGFGAGKKPPGGFVVRMDADGKNAELFAAGQRNTYDIAFSPEGELFGFGSDMEWDWGTPWYRPIRVNHI
ncbi:MAG: heme-binding protein, partial [Verrucomicrobia bacterium]